MYPSIPGPAQLPQTDPTKTSMKEDIIQLIRVNTSVEIARLIGTSRAAYGPIANQIEEAVLQALLYAQKLGPSADDAPRELVLQEVARLTADFEMHTRLAPWIQSIKKVMQGATPQKQTLATAQEPEASTPTTSAAVAGIQHMQRLIDQLIEPALTERAALDVVRTELEKANLHWAQNEHNMDSLDLIQDTLIGTLLHKAIKVVMLYKRLMNSSSKLRVTESWRKDKAQKRKKLMSELDRAVEILERLGLN